jgi:hypothetical protein
MKTKHFLVFICSIIVLSANALIKNTTELQDKKTVTVKGTFDGYDSDDGYVFLIKDTEDDSDEYIYFEAITSEALQTVNLQSESFIGKNFEIIYEVTKFEEEDEYGNTETYEKFTIVKLKQL